MKNEAAEILGLINDDAETTIAAALVYGDTNQRIDIADDMNAGDFHSRPVSMVFEAVTNLLRGIEEIDRRSILVECKAIAAERDEPVTVTMQWLEELAEVDFSRAVAYSVTVRKLSWLRNAAGFAYWMAEELQLDPEPNMLFAAAQERLQLLAPATTADNIIYGWDTEPYHAEVIQQRIDEQQAGISSPFDWPWASWNRIIRPLRAGMVGIVAAPDGQGKSMYLEIIAEHWAQAGKHVVFVHLENDRDYTLDRRKSRHARIAIGQIEDGKLTASEQQRIAETSRKIEQWAGCLHYYHAPYKSMVDIVRELESMQASGTCDAVVFDYLDKVQPTRGQAKVYGDNAYERQANDMERLKSFAETAGVPVMTATQGNKAMQGTGQKTRQQIQGSGQKSHKSQLVIILTREIVGENGLTDANGDVIAGPGEYSPIVNVRVDKQNRGTTGDFKQIMKGEHFNVLDMTMRKTDLNE